MPCRNHPFIEEGLEHCEICTETFCPDCLVEFRDKRTCGECKAQIVADLEGGLGVGGEGQLPPWEERSRIGWVGAFWQTSKLVMTAPTHFFSRVDKRAESWDCLIYIIILQVIVAIGTWLWVTLLFGVIFTATSGDEAAVREAFTGMFGMGVQGLVQIIFAPVGAVIGVMLGASLIHVFLLATKTAARPWHQTMRHYTYAQAPNLIAVLLPFVGGFVAGIWAIVTSVIMVKRVHGTTTMTAVASVLWFLVLILCCAGGAAAIIAFAAASSGQ